MLPWLARFFRPNYFKVHFLYFCVMIFIGAAILYGLEQRLAFRALYEAPPSKLAFIDSLFMITSAMCVTGLSTVDFAQFRLSSQIFTFFWIGLGSQVMMSAIPILIRRRYFRKLSSQASEMVEYRALGRLYQIIFSYFFIVQLLGGLALSFYLAMDPHARAICRRNNVNPVWWGAFTSVSAFNNAGFALFSDNMMQFATDRFILLILSALIVAGNTGFPIFLRVIVSIVHWRAHEKAPLEFLQRFPRRCSTHLFPSSQTVVLALSLLAVWLVEVIFFVALDFPMKTLGQYTLADKFLIALFQGFSTRYAGFNAVDIAILSPAMWIVYILMMYISAYPFVLTLRQSAELSTDIPIDHNAQQLSLYKRCRQIFMPRSTTGAQSSKLSSDRSHVGPATLGHSTSEDTDTPDPPTVKVIVVTNTQRIMARELSWLYVAILLICCVEYSNQDNITSVRRIPQDQLRDDSGYSTIKVFFEVVSAFGNVGLSLGFPERTPASFSAMLTPFSKFILILVMLFGRHRGLPESVDAAIEQPNRSALLDVQVKPDGTLSVASPLRNVARMRHSIDVPTREQYMSLRRWQDVQIGSPSGSLSPPRRISSQYPLPCPAYLRGKASLDGPVGTGAGRSGDRWGSEVGEKGVGVMVDPCAGVGVRQMNDQANSHANMNGHARTLTVAEKCRSPRKVKRSMSDADKGWALHALRESFSRLSRQLSGTLSLSTVSGAPAGPAQRSIGHQGYHLAPISDTCSPPCGRLDRLNSESDSEVRSELEVASSRASSRNVTPAPTPLPGRDVTAGLMARHLTITLPIDHLQHSYVPREEQHQGQAQQDIGNQHVRSALPTGPSDVGVVVVYDSPLRQRSVSRATERSSECAPEDTPPPFS